MKDFLYAVLLWPMFIKNGLLAFLVQIIWFVVLVILAAKFLTLL